MSKLSSQDACRWFRSNLSEIVSGEASTEVQAEAEAHRDRCSECESEYALAVRVEQGLGILLELFPGEAPGLKLERLFSLPGDFEMAAASMPLAYDPTQPVELSLSCHEFSGMLGDFVSEELPVGAMLDGVEHASSCRPCGDELSAMQTLQDELRSLGELEAPASILAALMARIETEDAAEAAADPDAVKVKQAATARSKLLPVLG